MFDKITYVVFAILVVIVIAWEAFDIGEHIARHDDLQKSVIAVAYSAGELDETLERFGKPRYYIDADDYANRSVNP